MRLGFITDNYPTTGGMGGIGSYTRTVGINLVARGHDVTVFTFGDQDETIDDAGITVRSLQAWSRRREMPLRDAIEFTLHHRNQGARLNGYQMKSAIRREVREGGRFNVIEAPEFAGIGAWVAGDKRLTELFAIHLQGSRHDDLITDAERQYERLAISRADAVGSCSRAALVRARRVLDLDFDAAIVPNPIEKRTRVPLKERSGPDVFFCGRLDPQKGVDVLLGALELLPDVTAVFAGLDSAWAEGGHTTADLAAKNPNIHILGVVPQWKTNEIVATAKIAVAPSRLESFGISVAEALAAGTPVVCSDIPAFREITDDGRVARLCESSSTALAGCIRDLLDDSELAERMSVAAHGHAQQWTVDYVVDQMLSAWHKALAHEI